MRPVKYLITLTNSEMAWLKKIVRNNSTNQTVKKRRSFLRDTDMNHGEKLCRKEIAIESTR